MKHYEIVLLFRVGQNEQVDKLITNYQKLITDAGGLIHRFEDWGRLNLAYPINDERSAKYILLNVECSIDTLNQFKETIRFNDFILRHLIMSKKTAETSESIMLQQIKESKSKQTRSE